MRIVFRLMLLLGVILIAPLVFRANIRKAESNPHSSGMLALTQDGQTLLAVNPDSNTVSLIATSSLEKLAEIPVGVDPRSVTIAPDDATAFVANQGSDDLSVIDITTRSIQATLRVGDRPVSVALSPDGRFLAVAEFGEDRVRFLERLTLATLSIIPVPDRPFGLAFTPDSRRLLVTHLLSGDVTILAVLPYQFYLPVISSDWESEFFTGQPLPLFSPSSPSLPVIATWPNVAPAPAVIVNSTGTRAYLPQTMANGLGLNIQFDNTVFPKVTVLNLETNSHQTSEHISLPETDQPVGLPWAAALTKADTELWVVNAASNDISVVDIRNPTQPKRTAHIPVGDNPRGIAVSPDGKTAYINNSLDGTISVIDTNAYTVTAVITSTKIPLAPLLLNGKRLFYSSANPALSQARWIACNTCHIEGEQDGRTWQLQFTGQMPIGAPPVITRNTTSLLGMIQTYPLRWSGEWNESADSEFAIRFEQFGQGLITGEMHPTLGDPNQGRAYDLDSLAAFIDSLQIPDPSHALTPSALNGQQLFFSQETGCATCHPLPYYTDFQAHDVGTANGPGEWFGPLIDTPTLRFLYDSPPYLHNGSAPTLLDVLTTANPNDEHGITSHLTMQQLEDLVNFLGVLPYAETP
jgi:YVTN family beta-propeller protein